VQNKSIKVFHAKLGPVSFFLFFSFQQKTFLFPTATQKKLKNGKAMDGDGQQTKMFSLSKSIVSTLPCLFCCSNRKINFELNLCCLKTK